MQTFFNRIIDKFIANSLENKYCPTRPYVPQPGIVRNLARYFGKSFELTAQQDKSTGMLRIPSPRIKSICAKTQDCLRTMNQLIQGQKFVI